MAANVLTMGNGKSIREEKKGASEKLESFMMRNRVPLLAVLGCLVLTAVVLCAVFGVTDMSRRKNLAALDAIEFTYTKGISELSDADISARQDAALTDLNSYSGKKGIVGARALMLAADIYFQRKDWAAGKDSYLKAAAAGEKYCCNLLL